MRFKKVILIFAFILVISFSFEVIAANIAYDDRYTVTSTSSDAKTWGGKSIDMSLAGYPADTDVYCFDSGWDGNYDYCFYKSESALSACVTRDPNIYNYCNNGWCFEGLNSWLILNVGSPGYAIRNVMDAKYYRSCNSGSYQKVDLAAAPYYVIKQRQYNCISNTAYEDIGDFGGTGYYSWWIEFNPSISCPSGKECDSSKDDDQADFGFYGTSIPSDPCNSATPPTPVCGDGNCDSGEDGWNCYTDCGSPCSSNQCRSSYWESKGVKQCYNDGGLCCSGDTTFGQYYCDASACDTYECWETCNSNTHTGCQAKGGYYCTNDGGTWKWRECAYGCSGSTCNAPPPAQTPDIRVDPNSLSFKFNLE